AQGAREGSTESLQAPKGRQKSAQHLPDEPLRENEACPVSTWPSVHTSVLPHGHTVQPPFHLIPPAPRTTASSSISRVFSRGSSGAKRSAMRTVQTWSGSRRLLESVWLAPRRNASKGMKMARQSRPGGRVTVAS